MKANELMEIVANAFEEIMKEGEFDSFEEMKNCYWWDSKDIHREAAYYVTHSETGWWLDEDTDLYYYSGPSLYSTDFIEYKKFINGVYKVLKSSGIYKEKEYVENKHTANRRDWWDRRNI